MEKKELTEKCINLYLEGKTYEEIAKITNFSRTYVTKLISNDERIIKRKNTKKMKVCKRKDNNQMIVYIPTTFLTKIGLSKDKLKVEYVDISIDEKEKNITIKKHSE